MTLEGVATANPFTFALGADMTVAAVTGTRPVFSQFIEAFATQFGASPETARNIADVAQFAVPAMSAGILSGMARSTALDAEASFAGEAFAPETAAISTGIRSVPRTGPNIIGISGPELTLPAGPDITGFSGAEFSLSTSSPGISGPAWMAGGSPNIDGMSASSWTVGPNSFLVGEDYGWGVVNAPPVQDPTAYRAYLNAKFGRSGNLDADINARGIDDAIRVNAYRSVSYARLSGTTSAQSFGTEAHQFFQRFNNRLANRVAGTYDVATEQFRDPLGVVVANRSPGSIGADVLYRPWRSSSPPTIFDLKTFNNAPRPINNARQIQFLRRFGSTAQEIYVPQW
jgi:hypothetical protein